MNRKDRREEVKKNKKLQIRVLKEMQEVAENDAIKQTVDAMKAAILMVLRNNYGFGRKRSRAVVISLMEQFDCIVKGYVSIEDIKQTIRVELDIEL